MKKTNLVLVLLAFIIVTSCNFSVSHHKEMKTKVKTIEGVDYLFSNYVEYRNYSSTSLNEFHVKSQISFYGMGKPIEKEVNKTDFEDKLGFYGVRSLSIDSISFNIYEDLKKIDLIYYIHIENEPQIAIFTLEKSYNSWDLN